MLTKHQVRRLREEMHGEQREVDERERGEPLIPHLTA